MIFPFFSSEDTLNLFAAYRSEAENHRMLRASSVLREIHTSPRLQAPDTRWWTSFSSVTEVFLKHIDIFSTLLPGQLLTLTSADSCGAHKSSVHSPKVVQTRASSISVVLFLEPSSLGSSWLISFLGRIALYSFSVFLLSTPWNLTWIMSYQITRDSVGSQVQQP